MSTQAWTAQEPSPVWLARPPVLQAMMDSGPLLALFNSADKWHRPILTWLQTHPDVSLHTTWPVLTEVCALLSRRVHNQAALDFLQWVQRGALQLDKPADWSLTSVLGISKRFASLPLDLADASIAEAAERLQIRHVVSIDKDFDVYRNNKGQALQNLLFI
ncbi:VapC toxin family PIN domain ribonuclease [Limnohabitans sp. T6-5]|uniref:type II toxin-antitoxin system VapC family toxin n=1 Tax=Limnohabitans sp. T6-5 TaxID=1100724 RepID=UPI000D3BD562|nr:PIN domain-containing protein [Limnohabitans sp. T6-5]PUE08757.1 VapC toxin family PIN domain ribonuclease [Limnohabitans sp. T6-5]